MRILLLEIRVCPAFCHGLTRGIVNGNTGAIAVADVGLRQRLEQRTIGRGVQSFPVVVGGPLKVTGKDLAVVGTREGIVWGRYLGACHINGATPEDARQFGSVQFLVLVREVWNTAIGRLLDGRYIQGSLLTRSQVRCVHCRLVEIPRKIPGSDAGRESEGYRGRKEVHLERLSKKMVVAELNEMWKPGVLHIACGSPDDSRSLFRPHRRKHGLQVPVHVVQGISRWQQSRSEASGAGYGV
jgi:hypothetical protein